MKQEYRSYYQQIGFLIRDYRHAAKMTQERLAESIGKSTAYISHLEAPGICKSPSLDTLIDISKALKVPLHKLTCIEE